MSSGARSNKEIRDLACGRWFEILTSLGVDSCFLSNKHGSCPICGEGRDRFRFDNKQGRGTYICSQCGAGDGFNLIAKCFGITNSHAFKQVASYLVSNNRALTPLRHSATNVFPHNTQQEDKYLLAKIKSASKHAKIILQDKCEYGQCQYFQNKGIDELFPVLKENYSIAYQEYNATTGNVENKTQTIYAGAVIISVIDIVSEEIIGAQFIYPNKGKFYIAGTPISKGIHIIRGNDKLPSVGVVEGVATGFSVSISIGATIVVVFDENSMKGKAERLKTSFSGKQLVFFGDNDLHKGHQKGHEAAHKGAALAHGFAVIPTEPGDWDDYRQKYGEGVTKTEIERQLVEFIPPIQINDHVIGISINSSILLARSVGVSFYDALTNHTNGQCTCPISGGKAVINHDSLYSYTLKRLIVPILAALHDPDLIAQCYELKTTKSRVIWVNHYNTQKHLYALVYLLRGRFGADILTTESLDRLLEKDRNTSISINTLTLTHDKKRLEVSPALNDFIAYLFESKIKQAAKLWELSPKQFKHHREIKQQDNGRLDWQPIVDEIIAGHYAIVAVQAIHGQGKTEDLAYKLSRKITPVVYTTLRAKLVAQGCTVLKFYHYQDDKKIIQMVGHVNEFACCTPSFKYEINLNHVRKAKLLIIDEFRQWFFDLLTNRKCISRGLPARLRSALKEAISNGCKIVLLDADLTTQCTQQFMRFLEIKPDGVLLVIAENPKRDLTIDISISTAAAHYQTHAIGLMKDDLDKGTLFLVAMESADAALNLYDELIKSHPDSHIVLLTGDRCIIHKDGIQIIGKSKAYIDKINDNLSSVDVCIYTSVIGTGVSIKHDNQRFTKCYGLFSGWVSSSMDAMQMLKRGRNVTDYVIGLLCRTSDLYMASFYNDLGADALHKLSIDSDDIDTIAAEIGFSKKQNSALFIPALLGLLRDKHKFKMIGQLSDETKIESLQSVSKRREEYQRLLIAAIPHPNLKQALSLQMDEYKDDEERFSCEARLCMDHYNIPRITAEAAELWFNPTRKAACERLELVVKLLQGDPELTVKSPDIQRELLVASGITLDFLTSRRLTHDKIISLRNTMALYCSQLVGLGFLPECYVKPSKISTAKPIIPVKKMLEYIGLNVTTKRTDKDRGLEISVPSPMAVRLKLDIKPTEEEKQRALKEIALVMHAEGKGSRSIATALNLKNKYQARRLLK